MPVHAARARLVVRSRRVRAALTHRDQLLLLNTPHNPTGKVFARAELEWIAGIAQEHDLMVLTDEVYDRIPTTARARSIATLARHVGADADDQFDRQNIQHDRLEDRLRDRTGESQRRRCARCINS